MRYLRYIPIAAIVFLPYCRRGNVSTGPRASGSEAVLSAQLEALVSACERKLSEAEAVGSLGNKQKSKKPRPVAASDPVGMR